MSQGCSRLIQSLSQFGYLRSRVICGSVIFRGSGGFLGSERMLVCPGFPDQELDERALQFCFHFLTSTV